jgi:hypothetical protein
MGPTRVNRLLSTIGSGILVKVVADEFKAWNPRLTSYLLADAVRRLPLEERERYEEEWKRNLEDIPGDLSRVCYVLSLSRAASRIRGLISAKETRISNLQPRLHRIFQAALAVILLIWVAPVLVLVGLLVRIASAGPILVPHMISVENGKRIRVWRFRTFSGEMTFDTDASSVSLGLPRTAIGRVLVKSNVDCPPELWSVMRGDATLKFRDFKDVFRRR